MAQKNFIATTNPMMEKSAKLSPHLPKQPSSVQSKSLAHPSAMKGISRTNSTIKSWNICEVKLIGCQHRVAGLFEIQGKSVYRVLACRFCRDELKRCGIAVLTIVDVTAELLSNPKTYQKELL
jgi:hypothetical protein